MKLTTFLQMLCVMFLTTGCWWNTNDVETTKAPLFCDVEEPRRFSQEELDWRAENAEWNLRRDFKTNKTWDRECIQ